MMPGMNPKDMQKAMKRLGIQQEDLDAIAVIIRTKKEDIIIRNPSVQRVNMAGQVSYQISGEEEKRTLEPEINEDDIKTVMEQANVNKEKALSALKEHDGDLAAAILSFK
jgi:nascent polypeptide-associated complex subunit alpha